MTLRTYSELAELATFADRFRYLVLTGLVGAPTFGYERRHNQTFYHSRQWKQVRHHVIARDQGCDLGIEGYEIYSHLHVHHMNPMTMDNIQTDDGSILDPEFLISTTQITHNAIHYGNERQLPRQFAERRPGDTVAWGPRGLT